MITTVTEIKHVENSFESFQESGIKIEFDAILVSEVEQDLPSDINCSY